MVWTLYFKEGAPTVTVYCQEPTYVFNFCNFAMDDIPYSRIRVIYVLRPCAVGFALRNVRDIF